MMEQEFRAVNTALVLRFEDMVTGEVIHAGRRFAVDGNGGFSVPVLKRDGYIVFTGAPVTSVRVESERYGVFTFTPQRECGASVLRVWLVPAARRAGKEFCLLLADGAMAYVGFGAPRCGYPLAAEAQRGAGALSLVKQDADDITDRRHLLLGRAGEVRPVLITRNLGYGHYALGEPLGEHCAAQEWRALPLRRVIGHETGALDIPVPARTDAVFVLWADGRADRFEWRE